MDNIKNEINEYGIINPDISQCNHDINSKDTSIIILDTPRTFTYPERIFGICKFCGKPFVFIKDDTKQLKLIEEEEDN